MCPCPGVVLVGDVTFNLWLLSSVDSLSSWRVSSVSVILVVVFMGHVSFTLWSSLSVGSG